MRRIRRKTVRKAAFAARLLPDPRPVEEINRMMLTPLVLRKAKKLGLLMKKRFEEWVNSKQAEWLPEGVPYKISENVRAINGIFVFGLNQPLILVSDLLNAAERRNVARHELVEWGRALERDKVNPHAFAVRTENPGLRKSALRKAHEHDSAYGTDL
jgi:hypothetical protein